MGTVKTTVQWLVLSLSLMTVRGAAAAFPDGWSGYVTHSVTIEPSSDLGDFTFLISVNQFPSDFWTRVQTDGDDIRASKDAGGFLRLPVDIIEFNDGGSSGSGLIAVRWTGTKSSSSNERVYIWAGNQSVSRPNDGSSYGRENAYADHVRAFWPSGGGEDRTRNGNDLTMTGSPAVGGGSGPINGAKSTDYDGGSQYGLATTSVPAGAPLTIIAYGNMDNATGNHSAVALVNSGATTNWFELGYIGSTAGDPVRAGASGNVANSSTGFSASTWAHGTARFTSSTNRDAAINGVFGSANTASAAPSGINQLSVGARPSGNFTDGRLSLVSVHASALSNAWVSYHQQMLDHTDVDQSDFFGTWTWRIGTSPVNALSLGFKAGDVDAASENSTLLVDACKARREIIWPAGDFYFEQIATANDSTFDQIAWTGAASEYAWQHQEEGGQGDKQLTRFILVGMTVDDVWLDMLPRKATRVGPWRIRNITFQIPTEEEGSIFRVGDPTENASTNPVSIRGLNVKGCYFTFEDHLAESYLVNDPMDDPDAGWVINRPHGRNFAWQVSKAYDTSFEDISIRGFYTNEFRQCDRLLIRNWRGGFCGRVIDIYGIGGASVVPALVNGLWCEGPWIVGANLEACEVHGLNVETGYLDTFVPRIGEQDIDDDNETGDPGAPYDDPRNLPLGMDWQVSAGSSGITFTGIPMGKVLSDYFEPRTVIRVEPVEPVDLPRYFYIQSIDDENSELHFRNASTTSYVHEELNGGALYLTRWFGTGVNVVGDQTAVFGHNVHANQILGDWDESGDYDGLGDFPLGFIVPGATPTVISGGVEGRTLNLTDETTRFQVVADDYGIQFQLCGGVIWTGPSAPLHPMVLKDGDPHLEYDPNVRSMEIDRVVVPGDADADHTVEPGEYIAKIRHRAFPGRGVTASYDTSLKLRFRTRADPILQRDVAVHRLSDGPLATYGGSAKPTWMIPGLSSKGQPVEFVVRIYASHPTQSFNDFVVYGGEGSPAPFDNLDPEEWHTVRGRLDASQVDDTTGEIWLGGEFIEVAWAEFWQDEEE